MMLMVTPATVMLAGCGIACERKDERYEGSQVVDIGLTADAVLASAEQSFSFATTWVPDPSENQVSAYGTSVPKLPFSGEVAGNVEVTALDDGFTDGYSYAFDEGCSSNDNPHAPARLILRTDDGVLDEEVDATIYPSQFGSRVTATLDAPRGDIAEFFDSIAEPDYATLLVTIEAGVGIDVLLRITREHDNGASYDNLTLLRIAHTRFEKK